MRIKRWKTHLVQLWVAYVFTCAVLLWEPLTGDKPPIFPSVSSMQEAVEALSITGLLVTVLTYGIWKHRWSPKQTGSPTDKRTSA